MSTLGLLFLVAIASIGTSVALGPPQIDVNDGKLCEECERVINELKKIVSSPETEKKFVDSLKKICNSPLLIPFRKQCLDKVDTFVTVLHELQSLLDDPKKVCQSLKQCENSNTALLSITADFLQSMNEPFSAKCDLCKKALTRAEELLDSPSVQAMIKSKLTDYCKTMYPEPDACDKGVEDVMNVVFPVLLKYLAHPELTCETLKFCSSTPANFEQTSLIDLRSRPNVNRFLAQISSAESLGIDFKCLACKATVGSALKLLEQDKIAAGLAKDVSVLVCKLFPKTLQAGCFDFLDIYGKPSIKLTAAELSATEICRAMHACPKAQQMESVSNPITCATCKALSAILGDELQQPPLEREIMDIVSPICKVVPDQVNKMRCQTFVETFFPYIITDIFALSLLPEMCTALHMC
jgi:hypothetical protein